MNFTPISALSPLDGRYASKLNALRPLVSELGYMHRRVQVEIAWFIALSDAGFAEFKPLSTGARVYLTGRRKDELEAAAEDIGPDAVAVPRSASVPVTVAPSGSGTLTVTGPEAVVATQTATLAVRDLLSR